VISRHSPLVSSERLSSRAKRGLRSCFEAARVGGVRFAWGALVVSALLIAPAQPCVRLLGEFDVGRDFDVQVSSRAKMGMAGVLVRLKGQSSLSVRTDAKGYASFRDVPIGEYEVSTAQRGDLNDAAVVRVKDQIRGPVKVDLTFPISAVVKTRRLAGTLEFAAEPLVITAVRQTDETTVTTKTTSANGDFDFDSVTPGLYTLEISSPGSSSRGVQFPC
jgi:hypothetical protein